MSQIPQKSNASRIDKTSSETKKYNNTKQSSTKLTSTQASLKDIEEHVYKELLDKRGERKPTLNTGDLVRTAD